MSAFLRNELMKIIILLILAIISIGAATSLAKDVNEKSHYLDQNEEFGVPNPSDLPGSHDGVRTGDSIMVLLGASFVFGFLFVSFFRFGRIAGIVFVIAAILGVILLGRLGLVSFQFSQLVSDEGDIVGFINGTGKIVIGFFASHLIFFFSFLVGVSIGLATPTTR